MMTEAEQRNDDLSQVVTELTGLLRGQTPSIHGGWMHPVMAFAFYSQNGAVKNVGNRIATSMAKSDWTYAQADVADFNWAPTQSRLETLRLKSKMRKAVLWWWIFGGAALEWVTEERGAEVSDRSRPLDPRSVKRVKRINVWSAYDLEPEPGQSFATSKTFRIRGTYEREIRIHRSRLAIVVGNDVPPGLGRFSSRGFINSWTGWPPSPLEAVYRSHTDWRNAENDVSSILHTSSLLHIALEGYRKARNGISVDEKASVSAMLQDLVDNLANDAVLFTDTNEKVSAITRNMAGFVDIITSKRLTYLADTGLSEDMVLGTSAGNLGDKSGPRRDFNTFIDGLRVDMLTPVIESTTNHVNVALKYRASLPPESEVLEIPTEYVTRWGPIDEQTGEEAAKQRTDEASAREKDMKTGVDIDVILSDPALSRDYTGHSAWLEAREEARQVTEAAKANQPQVPEDDLVSSAAIAKKLGVSSGKIISMIKSGEIPGVQIGARWKASLAAAWAAVHGPKGETGGAQDRTDVISVDGLGLTEATSFGECYGASVAMREIFTLLEVVAPSDLSVLITGESGTGKELVAHGLHAPRGGEFMAINCGAFEYMADLVAELGPMTRRGGTLFLDEVGELSETGQASVLRLLAEAVPRIVSATWRDLTDESRFRGDLYQRLSGIHVEVPPLRDREDDVLELAARFAAKGASDAGMSLPVPAFAPDAVTAMGVYHWPGNVRELVHAVKRGVLFSGLRGPITAEDMQIGGRR